MKQTITVLSVALAIAMAIGIGPDILGPIGAGALASGCTLLATWIPTVHRSIVETWDSAKRFGLDGEKIIKATRLLSGLAAVGFSLLSMIGSNAP